ISSVDTGMDYCWLVRAKIDSLRRISTQHEVNLLQVEDDVSRIFNDPGDRLKLLQHTFDFDSGNSSTFNAAEHHAAQRVADGGTESTLKGLSPEHTVFIGKRGGVGG